MLKTKKLVSIAMCMVLTVSAVMAVRAAAPEEPGIMPLNTYTTSAKNTLVVTSAGKATVTLTCVGMSTVSKIEAKTSIQKLQSDSTWSRINIGTADNFWYNTANSSLLSATRTHTLTIKGTFRARTVYTVTGKDGGSEKITVYSGKVTH